MTRIITKENCWQAFLASVLDLPLSMLKPCSTENEDWEEATQRILGRFDVFMVDVHQEKASGIPAGCLVGAHVDGPNGAPHIVVSKVLREGDQQAFEVYHDPSGYYDPNAIIEPISIVLICRAIQ